MEERVRVCEAYNEQSAFIVLHLRLNVLYTFPGLLIVEGSVFIHFWGVPMGLQSAVVPRKADGTHVRPKLRFLWRTDIRPAKA